jgi:hypothetical protein
MHDVEGLLHAATRLLDTGELEHMLELVFAIVPETFPLMCEGASLFGVALQIII